MTFCASVAIASTAGLVNINAYSYCAGPYFAKCRPHIRETCTVRYLTVQKLFIFRRPGYVGTTSRDTVYNHGLTSGYKLPAQWVCEIQYNTKFVKRHVAVASAP